MQLENVKEIKEIGNLHDLNKLLSNGWVVLAIAKRSFFKPFIYCIGKCPPNTRTEKSGLGLHPKKRVNQDNS
jgi:hypothetical protein